MKVVFGAVIALAVVGSAHSQQAKSPDATALQRPSYFVDGRKKDSFLLSMIQKGMAKNVDFNGHYSSSVVSCGTECVSFWFVDRRTGAVVAAPESPLKNEFIQDVTSKPDSDVVVVTYGPMDPEAAKCVAQPYRWNGIAFVIAGKRSTAKCPG
jgi:hypothetical protein